MGRPSNGRVAMAFVISAPRSGSTMLERMLEKHSMIHGGPEPHLLTPLAHLGVWDKVDKAPYDHILAAEAQKLFVSRLPGGEADYWAACRAYCDALYGRALESSGKPIYLDKTPANALILPFMAKVFPDAAYVVLTRRPAAIFSSYANSFFNGDYEEAHRYNPLLERYVPAIAAFLRRPEMRRIHVRYEDLVAEPEMWMRRIYDCIGVPFEPETIEYGGSVKPSEGLGDPLGVDRHARPTTESLTKWADELAGDPAKRAFLEKIIARLDPADLETFGYPVAELWKPLESAAPARIRPRLNRYRLQRRLIIALRAQAQRDGLLRKFLEKLRLACDVLLRE